MQDHSGGDTGTSLALLLRTRIVLGLGVFAFACRAPSRAETHATPAASPRIIASAIEPNLPAASATVRAAGPTAGALPLAGSMPRALEPDRAALVSRSAFPTCPSGATQLRRRAPDGRESVSCARVRGARVTLHGPSWAWFEGERLSRIDDYREGVRQGRSVRWFRSGVRRREGQFSRGLREGLWREFHSNGALSEEAHYEHGKMHALRYRFFASGRKSLEANYEHGVPTGEWIAFYDRDPPNLALTANLRDGREEREVTGLLPDGTAWKSEPKVDACSDGTCRSPLDLLDLEALPPLLPEPCAWGLGRNVPANELAPLVEAARHAWPKEEPGGTTSLGPAGCVERVRLSCAPNLDEEAGAEVLAEIRYRIYQADCTSASAREVSSTIAVVALSPPNASSRTWSERALIGYYRFDAPGVEQPSSLERGPSFVRLPNGEAALRVLASSDGGDCMGRRVDEIVVLRNGHAVTIKSRTLTEGNQRAEPEETDLF
jgi:hypothetical protein